MLFYYPNKQWGTASAGAIASEIALPISFRNLDFKIITNCREAAESGYQICVLSRTLKAFKAYYYKAGGSVKLDYIALGS